MRSLQRLRDIVAQRIDRGADIENEAGLAFKRHALGEVAGDRGLDDAADRRLELIGHPGQRRLTLDLSLPVLLGLLSRLAFRLFRRFDLEGFDRLGDVADLILALEARQHHAEIALGKFPHTLGQSA